MKINLILAILISAFGICAQAANFCFAYNYVMPDFGLSYSYRAKCNWTDKELFKSTFALFGYVQQEVKEKMKSEVAQELAAVGVKKISQIANMDVFSDSELRDDQSICMDYFGKLGCSEHTKLTSDPLALMTTEQILLSNGYKKVANFPSFSDSRGLIGSVSFYVK